VRDEPLLAVQQLFRRGRTRIPLARASWRLPRGPAALPRRHGAAQRGRLPLRRGLEYSDTRGEPRGPLAGKGPGWVLAATGCLRRPPTLRGRLGRRCTRLGGREGPSGPAGALRGLALGGLLGWLPRENENPLGVLCPPGLPLRSPGVLRLLPGPQRR